MATIGHRLCSVEDVADLPAEEPRIRLECLYREHAKRVHAICASVLRDRHEAEDAAQQVFLSAFHAMLRGHEPRDPAAWLVTIARNESRARARRSPSVALQPELRDDGQEDPSTVVARRSELARVWRAIESLPASQREALLLREVRGLRYHELADDLQLSHASVRSLISRARRTLRSQVERGAAALTGAPWLNVFARIFGDASSPALSSVSRTAAVGLGALAITGGAIVVPSQRAHSHQRQAMHVGSKPPVAASSPAVPAGRAGGATAPLRQALGEPAERHRRLRVDHFSRRHARGEGHRDADGTSGSSASADNGSSGSGGSASDSHGGPSMPSDGGGLAPGASSGPGGVGHDASVTDGRSGDALPSLDTSGRTTSGGGSGSSDGPLTATAPAALSTSSGGGGPSGSSAGFSSDGGPSGHTDSSGASDAGSTGSSSVSGGSS